MRWCDMIFRCKTPLIKDSNQESELGIFNYLKYNNKILWGQDSLKLIN